MRRATFSPSSSAGKHLSPLDEDRNATFQRHESAETSSSPVAIKLYGYDCDRPANVRLYIHGKNDLSKEILNVSSNGGREWQTWRPPLHWAAILGSTECVKLLLDAGADPLQKDREEHTPLQWAQIGNAPKELIALLCEAQGIPVPGPEHPASNFRMRTSPSAVAALRRVTVTGSEILNVHRSASSPT